MSSVSQERLAAVPAATPEAGRAIRREIARSRSIRYTFLCLGLAFLIWEGFEVVVEGEPVSLSAIAEVAFVSVALPSLVWRNARQTERLRREAYLNHMKLLAAHQMVMQEVEKRRKTEEEHKRLAEFNRSILDSMDEAISVIDVDDFRLTTVNRSFLTQMGAAEEEVIGKTCYQVTHHRSGPCIPPDDMCPLVESLKTGRISAFEHVHLNRDGGKRYVEVFASPLRDRDGEITQVVHMARDITARKLAEEEATIYAERLQRLAQGLSFIGALPQGEMLPQLLETLMNVTDSAQALYFRFDADTKTLTLEATTTSIPGRLERDGRAQEFRLGEEQGLVGLVAAARKPLYIPDPSSDPRCTPVRPDLRSVYLTPVVFGDSLYGVVQLFTAGIDGISDKTRFMADTVAAYAGATLENNRLWETERSRSQEVEALFNIASILVQPGSFEERAGQVMEVVLRVSQADRVILRVRDESTQRLRVDNVVGVGPGRKSPLMAPGGSISTTAFLEGRPVIANDYASHPGALPATVEAGIRSAVALPIRVQDVVLGVFSVGSLKPNHFTSQRVGLLNAIVNGMGSLLENARLLHEISSTLEGNRQRLEAFRLAAEQLALEAQPEHTLRQMVDLARKLLGARYGALAVWGPENSITRFIVSGLSASEQQHIGELPRGLGIPGLVRDEKKSLRLADVSSDPRACGFPPGHPSIKSLLSAPVVSRGNYTGVLLMGNKEGAPEFSEDDEQLLGVFAVQTGVFLDNLALYEDEARERGTLEAIQSSMTDGMAVLGPDGRVQYCNQAALDMVGIAREEVVGRPLGDILSMAEAELESTQDAAEAGLMDILSSPRETPASFAIKMKWPRPRGLLLTIFPVPAEPDKGAMTGILVRDVTEERDLTRRRDEFVSIASHELRTPMTSLVGFTELLLHREVPRDTRQKWVEHIHREALRLTEIVDDMLNVSRTQTGKLPAILETTSLAEVVEESLVNIRPTIEKHELVCEIPPDIPLLHADRGKLNQVLTNLLVNAVKYSPQGGTVTISARHEPERERVVVSVADQGIGIGPEDRERLFTTFHRIRRPETVGIRGSGLGLYIVKTLVELMQGEVWLDSELGKGSTFFFSLSTRPKDAAGERLSTLSI